MLSTRYSTLSFPEYSYIPGRTKRHNQKLINEKHTQALTKQNWSNNSTYLYGIDLYNHGFYWETHEVLEVLWHMADKRNTETGRFLQGLIQFSVAFLKFQTEQSRPGKSLCLKALKNLHTFEGFHFGVNTSLLKETIQKNVTETNHNKIKIDLKFDEPSSN